MNLASIEDFQLPFLFQLFTLGRLELECVTVANLRDKTQNLLRQTAVDSDFTQNF